MDATVQIQKIIRNEKARYARMNFRYEKPGTQLYVYSGEHNDEYIFSKNKINGCSVQYIKKLQVNKLNIKGYSVGYLNVHNLLQGDYYTVCPFDNGYRIIPAGQKERKIKEKYSGYYHQTGYVGFGGRMALNDYKAYIFSKKKVEVTVDVRDGLYLSLKPTDNSKLPTRRQLMQTYGTYYLSRLEKCRFKLSSHDMSCQHFYLPTEFQRMTQAETGTVLPVYKCGDEIIIEGKTEYCSVCGQRINYYLQPNMYVDVCEYGTILLINPMTERAHRESVCSSCAKKIQREVFAFRKN